MHVPINVKSPNNIIEWQMKFNSAFKGLIYDLSAKYKMFYSSEVICRKLQTEIRGNKVSFVCGP
jgi:hypothetical protein